MRKKELRNEEIEQRRGWIIHFLYLARPKTLVLSSLMRLLDRRNFPLSRHRLAEELHFLCEENLVRVCPLGTGSLNIDDQTRLLERYAGSDSDDDVGAELCARLSNKGVIFQEGNGQIAGIARVE